MPARASGEVGRGCSHGVPVARPRRSRIGGAAHPAAEASPPHAPCHTAPRTCAAIPTSEPACVSPESARAATHTACASPRTSSQHRRSSAACGSIVAIDGHIRPSDAASGVTDERRSTRAAAGDRFGPTFAPLGAQRRCTGDLASRRGALRRSARDHADARRERSHHATAPSRGSTAAHR